ncbi:coenzyme F420-0:L-glutamate ligase [Candidatus Roizmanbacteria bacterium]|nr:coenzyme F420-0:L-glutamate ligase [Candidatus Roizmanbacteria bacterium]
MIVTPIRTHKITNKDTDIAEILGQYISTFPEKSVLGIAAKIVSICEGRYIPLDAVDKDELIKQESQWYTDRATNPLNVSYTITNNMLVATAGIDESNAFGNYILLPEDPQKSANHIREYLVKRFNIRQAGVVIVDGHTVPFRWGVMGQSIAHSGFEAITWNKGSKDLFGREIKMSNQNIVEGLAASASLVMGEAAEQTPLSIISDVPFVTFQDRNPTQKELDTIKISREEDMYWPLIKHAPWKKGKRSRD